MTKRLNFQQLLKLRCFLNCLNMRIKQLNPLGYHWQKEEKGMASAAGTAQGAGWPQQHPQDFGWIYQLSHGLQT